MTLFGNLTWQAIPWNEPLPLISGLGVFVIILAIVAWVFIKGYMPYLWREWITSVDHKRIGVMYCILAGVMLLRGFIDAIMMRTQQAMAYNAPGFLPPSHFAQVFSAHGTIMIFFVAMPFVIGLMNVIVPLQLGVRDVAFPTLNSVSFWLTAAGALLINLSLVVGEFDRTGWLPYPPLSELAYSPGTGVDYYCWSLQISGLGTLLTGINFVTTILKLRAPGMHYTRMPMFCWTALASNLLIVAAFPVLTATLAMLLLDRYVGFHFFTDTGGGNSMMFMNLIWAWGHPEVYILALPAFGIYSEIISTFSNKPLFGYRSMIYATMAICIISFMVWLHHFFTMGAGADVNAIFGIASMIIAVPTGVKIFNWLFTMYGGSVRFHTPMLWSIGFIVTFAIGGMTGVLLAVPPADFQLHNSVFLVAHFHNVIIGAVLFGAFAGYVYWFPKAFGFTLDERLGKWAFWLWLIGFWVAWAPGYVLGLEGMTRRLQTYDVAAWRPWLIVAEVGVFIILLGIIAQIAQIVVSVRTREKRRDVTGDPWDGRNLEWATSSPPPAFNFAVLPDVSDQEPYWDMKERAREIGQLTSPEPAYEPIHMPRNSPTGFVSAFLAVVMGFALIWHIWWLVVLGLVGAYAIFVVFAWRDHDEELIPAEEVARLDRANRAARSAALQHRLLRQSQREVRTMSPPSTTLRAGQDPYHMGHGPAAGVPEYTGHGAGGPSPKRIVVGYGFWIFILSDVILFSCFFATYTVLIDARNGGPGPQQLFDLHNTAIETACLLLSSFTCGMTSLAVARHNLLWTEITLAITGLLGLTFLGLEGHEFLGLVAQGAGPTRSAFLTAFFALVGCHGVHVTCGILWLGTMMAQFPAKGFKESILHRYLCFSLFWHALDIIWIGIFTVVYLIGTTTP